MLSQNTLPAPINSQYTVNNYRLFPLLQLDAGVMAAITKGHAFGHGKLLHAYVLW
jgi:hypothetical protein